MGKVSLKPKKNTRIFREQFFYENLFIKATLSIYFSFSFLGSIFHISDFKMFVLEISKGRSREHKNTKKKIRIVYKAQYVKIGFYWKSGLIPSKFFFFFYITCFFLHRMFMNRFSIFKSLNRKEFKLQSQLKRNCYRGSSDTY